MCIFLRKSSGERASTSLSATDSLVTVYFHAVHLPVLPLQLVLILYKLATLEEKTSGFSPHFLHGFNPHEDSNWHIQAACNCLTRWHPNQALRKPFFLQGRLFRSMCEMEILLSGAEVHILDNRAQLSLSAQRRADRGMPALPVLCPGWMWARSPAEIPSPCWQRAHAPVPVLSRAYWCRPALRAVQPCGAWMHAGLCPTSLGHAASLSSVLKEGVHRVALSHSV